MLVLGPSTAELFAVVTFCCGPCSGGTQEKCAGKPGPGRHFKSQVRRWQGEAMPQRETEDRCEHRAVAWPFLTTGNLVLWVWHQGQRGE